MNGRKAREQERKKKWWPRSIDRCYGEISLSSIAVLKHTKNWNTRTQNKNRSVSTLWWNEEYYEWNDKDFKDKIRLKWETLNATLEKISEENL